MGTEEVHQASLEVQEEKGSELQFASETVLVSAHKQGQEPQTKHKSQEEKHESGKRKARVRKRTGTSQEKP